MASESRLSTVSGGGGARGEVRTACYLAPGGFQRGGNVLELDSGNGCTIL